MTERPATLVVMALEIEAQGVFERAGVPVLYTGLGKVNAALSLMRALRDYHHAGQGLPLVLNFGTAGSHSLPAGTLVACQRFVQRDMDVSGLGFAARRHAVRGAPGATGFPGHFRGIARGAMR